jgi:hypothetical protein
MDNQQPSFKKSFKEGSTTSRKTYIQVNGSGGPLTSKEDER